VDLEPHCIVCLFRLASRAARAATSDPRVQGQVIDRLADEMPALPPGTIPPQIGRRIQQIVRELSGNGDPFREARLHGDELALQHYPVLKRQVERAADPLLEAIRLAAAGNAIDLAACSAVDLTRVFRESPGRQFAVFDYARFRALADGARRVLYIADNAGEIVFDRLLVEELMRRGSRVTVAVRAGPVINDACIEDARRAGFAPAVEIIDTGSDLPSVILGETGETFRERYGQADLVISKGQGNFEGLREERRPIAFLLMAKCRPVAAWLGVEQGTLVLRCRDGDEAEEP